MAGERQPPVDAASGEALVSSSITGPPPRVTFPDAFRNQGSNIAPMKLEVEESAEAMSPRNMWQVYALGGFMVIQWFWARWKERRDKGSA